MTSIFLNPQAHSLAHIWEKNIWPFTKREESGEEFLLLLIHDYSKHSKFVQQSNRFIAPTSHDLFFDEKTTLSRVHWWWYIHIINQKKKLQSTLFIMSQTSWAMLLSSYKASYHLKSM